MHIKLKNYLHNSAYAGVVTGIAGFIFLLVSNLVYSEPVLLGDAAPRGAPDGQLNAADALILQKMVLGDIIPLTSDELLIGDVAPLGNPDGILNAGDLVVQQRAILGEITLGTVNTSPPSTLLPPTLNTGISPTNDNPYLITGKASPGASVDIYIAGVARHQTTGDAITGVFSVTVYLFDGVNNIYAAENDGIDISPPSNILQIQYDNVIDRNNLPTSISVDTVWTASTTLQPYIIPSRFTISSNAKLIIQPGVSIIFEGKNSLLDVHGDLIIQGTNENKVLLTASNKLPGEGWDGIYVNKNANVKIDNAIIEYANSYNYWPHGVLNSGRNVSIFYRQSAIFFTPGSGGSITNTLIQFNRRGIELRGASSPVIGYGNTITQNGIGLSLYGASPTINGNKIFNNTAFNFDGSILGILNARGNYWGSTNASEFTAKNRVNTNSGILDFSGYLDANGDVVPTGNILQNPIQTDTDLSVSTSYEIYGNVIVEAGSTLTIPKGVTLIFTSGAKLTVYGNLIVQGTQTDSVNFTSGRDNPKKSDWRGINIKNGGSADIDYAVIEYAYQGIYFEPGSDGTVSNTIIRNNSEGIRISDALPAIGPNNIITLNGDVSGNYGINLQLGATNLSPEIKNNQIFDNTDREGRARNIAASAAGGRNVNIDVRGNYWGSVDASEIVASIKGCSASSSDPCVDFGGYLDANGNVVGGVSLLIGVIQEDTVLQANTTYEVLDYIEIPAGITLTIPSGVKLVFVSLNDGMTVYGNLVVTGTKINPVVFTSAQTTPVKGARSYPDTDWDGIYVYNGGDLFMTYAIIEYADKGISFSGYADSISGNIANSVFEYNGVGIAFYRDANNITISNNLFRYNGMAFDIWSGTPVIESGNVITQNDTGINVRSQSGSTTLPTIIGNKIFDNNLYNINSSLTVDAQGNYWGSDDPVEIASKINGSGVDFSNFILTANAPPDPDVPPSSSSPVVVNELQICPTVRVTDDTNYIDTYPDENIDWIGNNYTDVAEIEKAFNNARAIDNTVFQYLKMPSQVDWNAMSTQQQGLYLINSERRARGIKPFEGVSPNIVTVVTNYADYTRVNNLLGYHFNDGKTPTQRLDEDLVIRDNREGGISEINFSIVPFNVAPSDSESVVRAVYTFTYFDEFTLVAGTSWGHRGAVLATGYDENSGVNYKEGLLGFGISAGSYLPIANPSDQGSIVIINMIDPSATWDFSNVITVDTDNAQQCNNRVTLSIDETAIPVAQIKSLLIKSSDIYLTLGITAQLTVIATYLDGTTQDITSAASFVADNLSVIDINAGTITALRNGYVYAIASANGVTSNSVLINVGNATGTSNLAGTNAANYAAYIPNNASISQYDPKVLNVFTGIVNDNYGDALNDVTIAIHNKPEYGSVKTDINGRFTMAAEAGTQTLAYSKIGYLTVHRKKVSASNAWTAMDDVIMMSVDSVETSIDLNSGVPQIHTSSPVTDAFGTRSTTLVFNGISTATVTSADGTQRALSELVVRATEYELPQSMPAELPKESAFTYCAELEVLGVRDDEKVTFDNDVVMYVDNFLNFNPGEIVPIGYYDRQIGEWVESSNGIVVKLLDTDNNGQVDGLDINNDNIADDLNQNGNTADEVAGIESYSVGKTYWRGSFNHFTPVDYNWPFIPPGDAINPGKVKVETSNNNKNKKECTRTGSYVKPETQAFNEDIPITGTNLTLHYSSQRTEGYKHQFNVQVSGSSIPASMIEMIVKLEIGGNVFQQSFTPQADKEAEFIWDGNDPNDNRVKGLVNGLISIGFKYNTEYASAGTAATPTGFATVQTAWAQIGTNSTAVPGRDEFISWSSNPISVQNTFDNQLANGWTLSNHHLSSAIGSIYKGDGEVMDTEKTSLILKTGVKVSQYNFDDGFYQKGGSDIDYEINANGELFDKTTQLKWQYTDTPEKFINKQDAIDYCSAASFAIKTEGWRLPTNKELNYIIDKSGKTHAFPMYNTDAIFYWHQASYNVVEKKLKPVLCVKGIKLDDRYIADLVRDNGAEVVVDTQNGLMWQDDVTTTTVKRDWTGAIDYCENDMDGFAGYTDWRLPNINELIYSLPNTTFVNFTTIPPGPWNPASTFRKPYWASSPGTNATNTKAWAIESKGLSSETFAKTDLYNIRCVRDNIQAAKSPYKFDINGKHAATIDTDSGLILTSFAYDANDQLITITDQFGDALTINRDPATGKALSITTQDGYVTQLSIDTNNDLKQVDYADGTNYQFIYDAVSLLTSKTDPNTNVFLHQFDAKGRTIQTSDVEGGLWTFSSTRQGNSSALYGYSTAELNTYQTLRTILNNGDTNKVTTLFDGTQLTDLNQADDLKQTLQSCGVTTVIDKVIDSKTKEPIPSLITITQPSLLQNITTLTKSYGEGGADATKQTLLVNLNGNTSTVFTDSVTGVTQTTSAENRTTTLNADPATLLLQSSQTLGLLDTSYTYDTRGRQKTITTGTRTTTFTYNPVSKGDVTYITADDGKQTWFEYDALGRVSAIVYPDGNRTENNYDNNGNLTTLVIPTPANHISSYNAVNNVKTETTPKDGVITEVTQYDYDTEKNLTQITLPSGNLITNTYTKGQLDFITTPEGIINYSYTCNSKIAGISESTENISYGYDGSLLTDISYAGALNKVISQTYNNDFNINSLTYAGQTNSIAYDKDGLLTSTNGYTITRNTQNGLPETVENGTLLQTRGFNGYGEADTVTTKINNKNVYDYTLSYNDLGKITNKTETLDDGTINTYVYTYDDRRRLTNVTKNNTLIESYSYNANGNRTLQTNTLRSISNQSASYNLGDQLTSNGSTNYDYDADGYLSKKTTGANVTTYQYSSQGRLLQVITPTKTISYQHNAIGNRVAKLVDGVVTEKYLWLDKTTLLAIYDGTDTLLQRYQYTDSNTPNSFTQGGQTYYIVTDHLGSPRAITNNSGLIVKKIDYDSFGNIISDSNSGFSIPFGFAGGLQDVDTGLVRFGFRDYDADTGRWTARDPIGFGGGDTNLYGYVFSDPLNFIDSDGRSAQGLAIIFGGGYLIYKGYQFCKKGGAAADKGLEVRDKKQKEQANIEAMFNGTPIPYPDIYDGGKAEGELSQSLINLGLSAPPGTSLSGPPVNPASAIDVGGSIGAEILINSTDGR